MMPPVRVPNGVAGRVMAMGRPRRPDAERTLVRTAATGGRLSVRCAAAHLADAVARLALQEIDREPEPVIELLFALADTPAYRLATDAEIDTMSLVRAERAARAEARGGRRLREVEWPAEDRATIGAVSRALARRYERYLRMCA